MKDELHRYHVYLDRSDAEWFQQMFGEKMGFSRAIRMVMQTYRKNIEAAVDERRGPRSKVNAEQRREIAEQFVADKLGEADTGEDPGD